MFFKERIESKISIDSEQSLNTTSKILNARDAYKKAAFIFKGVFNIATMVSDFDLKLAFYGNKIKRTADNLNNMFSEVAASSEEISTSTTQIVNTNSELNHIITHISKDAETLQENTEQSNTILSNIKTENKEMIIFSKDMDESVSDLLTVINKINDVVKDINKISDQTKILSLNASIEAARAGVAGKGFAVVAGEIRTLSETTKGLTSKIDTLLLEMNNASNKSKLSVKKTSASIDRVSGSIENVSNVMSENSNAIGNIAKRITEAADMSNEINDSLQESSSALESVSSDMQSLLDSAEELKEVSSSVNSISELIGNIDVTVQDLAVASGKMVSSKMCGLTNEDFIETVENAIKAHKNWVLTVKTMVKDMKVLPLQTNEHKCGFGHFYYSVHPTSKKLIGLWEDVESIHHSLHKSGDTIINSIKKNDIHLAQRTVLKAEELSGTIINKFEEMIKIAKEMTLIDELVF